MYGVAIVDTRTDYPTDFFIAPTQEKAEKLVEKKMKEQTSLFYKGYVVEIKKQYSLTSNLNITEVL